MSGTPLLVASCLVRNESIFVERAIRNAAAACDRVHVVDHASDDGTWEIVQRLARELDHVDARRSPRASTSHEVLESYAGSATWVLGVDGDELFDPVGLLALRGELAAGVHADVFRLKGHVLNCDELDVGGAQAWGWLAPPSRPVTKLFNFAALDSWTDASERLHDGRPVFRDGFGWDSLRYLSDGTTWETDPLRCLHVCFLPRSPREAVGGRENLNESRRYDRSLVGAAKRIVRRPSRPTASWKRDWYARGERVCIDAAPFLGEAIPAPRSA